MTHMPYSKSDNHMAHDGFLIDRQENSDKYYKIWSNHRSHLSHTTSYVLQKQVRCLFLLFASFMWLLCLHKNHSYLHIKNNNVDNASCLLIFKISLWKEGFNYRKSYDTHLQHMNSLSSKTVKLVWTDASCYPTKQINTHGWGRNNKTNFHYEKCCTHTNISA
jgi:hypothetical protein